MQNPSIIIGSQFNGPKNSSNGGYACGRVAEFIDGTARVRLRIPPPLDVRFQVRETLDGVIVVDGDQVVAEAWPTEFDVDVPAPPTAQEAELASKDYIGFKSHRFVSCFVCGVDRKPGDGMRIYAGPVPGRNVVACTWTPDRGLSADGDNVDTVYLWGALDCAGGFSFPHPESGTILLGELSVKVLEPVPVGARYVVIGWELEHEGRRHRTGTALFSESGTCHGVGLGVWFEVPDLETS